MLVKPNGRVDTSEVPVPEPFRDTLSDPTPQTLEGVIRWIRGPTITAKPTRPSFPCDGPIELDLVLTNESPMPMTLEMPPGDNGAGALFSADLWDRQGVRILAGYEWAVNLQAQPGRREPEPVRRTLPPGASLPAKVSFLLPLSHCAQDPANARTLSLILRAGGAQEEAPGSPRLWRGLKRADVPIRVTCPYAEWASTLAQPSGPWLALIGNRSPFYGAHIVSCVDGPVPMSIGLAADGLGAGRLWAFLGYDELPGTEIEALLAPWFRVTRDGVALPGPQADRETAAARLEKLRPRHDWIVHTLDLAKHFPFDRPGTYRVRLVLPAGGGDSLSNVLTVRILDEKGGGLRQ
jgi:hypothetical protein